MSNLIDIYPHRDIIKIINALNETFTFSWNHYKEYFKKKRKALAMKSRTGWVKLHYKVIPEKVNDYIRISYDNHVINRKVLPRIRVYFFVVKI